MHRSRSSNCGAEKASEAPAAAAPTAATAFAATATAFAQTAAAFAATAAAAFAAANATGRRSIRGVARPKRHHLRGG